MKILIRIAVICIFIFVTTWHCQYINKPIKDEELPSPQMVHETQLIINKAPYEVHDYKERIFDCSNETALLYDFLTVKGFNRTIVIGAIIVGWEWFPVKFHAWLIVGRGGKKILIEPTAKLVVYQDYFKEYIALAHLRSLKFLQILSKILLSPNEWTY